MGRQGEIMGVVRINIPAAGKHIPDLRHEVRPHFPHPSFRRYQDQALCAIWAGLNQDDFDDIIVQAPTGIGKSGIGMAVASRFDSGYVLTPTLGLTQQYLDDFSHKLFEVKGRGNFDCWVQAGTASDAPCYTAKGGACPHSQPDKKDLCPYYEQRNAAESHPMVLSNPSYMFRVQQGSDAFTTRDVAVIDEAHNLERFFLDLLQVEVSVNDWKLVFGMPHGFPTHYHAADWLPDVERMMKRAGAQLTKSEEDGDEKMIKRLRNFLSKAGTLTELLQEPNNVVLAAGPELATFKPVRARTFIPEYLDRLSKKRVYLSATILDIDTFVANLGIEDRRVLYVNVTDSPFKSENFNVHYAPCGPMSWGKRKHTIPKQVKAIIGMMEHYPDKRGVVLPHSHAIRRELVQGLQDAGYGDRVLTHDDNARGRNIALNEFTTNLDKPYVLISTYVSEGFDFKGKLAEWLVICKIPYLYTPDPQIAQRMEQDEHNWRVVHENTPECPYSEPSKYSGALCGTFMCTQPCQSWSKLQTAMKLVQMVGRIVRTPDDVGHIFILDRAWDRFLKNHGMLLPSWFKTAVREQPNWLKKHTP